MEDKNTTRINSVLLRKNVPAKDIDFARLLELNQGAFAWKKSCIVLIPFVCWLLIQAVSIHFAVVHPSAVTVLSMIGVSVAGLGLMLLQVDSLVKTLYEDHRMERRFSDLHKQIRTKELVALVAAQTLIASDAYKSVVDSDDARLIEQELEQRLKYARPSLVSSSEWKTARAAYYDGIFLGRKIVMRTLKGMDRSSNWTQFECVYEDLRQLFERDFDLDYGYRTFLPNHSGTILRLNIARIESWV